MNEPIHIPQWMILCPIIGSIKFLFAQTFGQIVHLPQHVHCCQQYQCGFI